VRVVITGASGFLGARLARELAACGTLVDAQGTRRAIREIIGVDNVAPARATTATATTNVSAAGASGSVARAANGPSIEHVTGDLADPATIARALAGGADTVFHLAAVVSGAAEADFDLGMRVNIDATRRLLEACRALARPPKFVFASSVAVFGGRLPDPVPDDAPLHPQTSYGTQKAIAELLVDDMTRKGYLDGRSLRLPTVTVRPGKPNRAASSFASGIVREPLAGLDGECPVGPEARMWVISPRAVIDNLIIGHDAPAAAFDGARAVNVPGLCVSVGEMVEALREVAGAEVAAHVRWQRDPVIDRMVSTWPARFAAARGLALGMHGDRDFAAIVRAYIDDDLPRR
jgi:nucleoside-diphosphate-sugar epimerase